MIFIQCYYQKKMSDLRVKNCIDYLRIVLTKLIKISKHKNMHIMLDEVLRLKNYVSSINDTSIKVGKILTILVNNYMILITSQGEDLTQISETLISTPEQALAILNGPQNERLKKTQGLLTTCQQKLSHKPYFLTYLQSTFYTTELQTHSLQKQDMFLPRCSYHLL